jgi:hypothetical protein
MRIFFIIAALLVCLHPVSAQQPGITATPDFTPRLDLMDVVTARYERTIALIKSDFPDDYTTLVVGIAAISWQGRRNERVALLRAFELMKDLRRKYAARVVHAPSVSHSVMLGLLADFYEAVFEAEGPAVCGRFAQDGSAVLFDLGLSARYADRLDLQSVAYFDAVVKAIEVPENPGPVLPDDWNKVLATMVAAGAPPSYVETVARGDSSDPDLCPALAVMFRTVGLLNTPEGARARADFARNLAGY